MQNSSLYHENENLQSVKFSHHKRTLIAILCNAAEKETQVWRGVEILEKPLWFSKFYFFYIGLSEKFAFYITPQPQPPPPPLSAEKKKYFT